MVESLEKLSQGGREQLMTQANSQLFLKVSNIDCFGSFNEMEISPRCAEKKFFQIYSDHFCVIFKSENTGLKQADEEVTKNFNKKKILVDDYLKKNV